MPGGLVVVPTLVSSESHVFPVQVVNMSEDDIWLRPSIRLGVLTHVDSVKSDEFCEVQFKRISADTEQVSIDKHPETQTVLYSTFLTRSVSVVALNSKLSWLCCLQCILLCLQRKMKI